MINPKKIALTLSVILFSFSVEANDITTTLKNISLANVNALIILTSQDMLTSGSYSFKGGSDLKIYNFPGYYHFSPFGNNFNMFVNGSIGYSKLEKDLAFDFGPDDKMEYTAIPMRFGGGMRYLSSYDISLIGGFNLIYTHIENSYDYNNDITRELLKPIFDQVFANQSSEAYTYEVFWRIGYYPNWNNWKPYTELTSNYFQSTAKVDLKSASSFKSSSASAVIKIGFETPRFLHLNKTDISTEFFVASSTFAGDVRDTLGFDEYGSAAMLIHLHLNETLPLLNRVDFMVENVKGGGLDGYNIGIGAGFKF